MLRVPRWFSARIGLRACENENSLCYPVQGYGSEMSVITRLPGPGNRGPPTARGGFPGTAARRKRAGRSARKHLGPSRYVRKYMVNTIHHYSASEFDEIYAGLE